MARQHKVLSGGVIVLCLTLLLAPVTQAQFTARIKKVSISGSVGLPGVTMQGLPGAPTTNENGVYAAQVDYGWKGTVTPVKLGYTFEPNQRVYPKATSDLTDENYSAELLTFTISGSTGIPGVKLIGLPGEPISDQNGRYTATVEYGWSDNVTPEKIGYKFDPPSTMYAQVRKNLVNQNYKASELTFTISGSVGADGVAMKGLPGNVVTSGGGNYRAQVPYGWSGKVTPTKEGHSFTPEFYEYPTVTTDQMNQSYTASVFTYQISGTTNQAGVILKGLPEDPISDTNGYYSVMVPHGWQGTVTPELAGFTFSPPSKTYPKVVSDYENQDYNPTIIQLTISGSAGTSGVRMDGLPGNVVTGGTGRYSAQVEYGWSGTVSPTKEGWDFEPATLIYASVTGDQLNQIYKAERIKYTISGNVGLPGVVLQGLPGRVVSGVDGSFSAEVDYNWTGKVTPQKPGFEFDPATREYSDLLMSQMAQDFTPQIIQRTISGRIVGEDGPLADVLIFADNSGGTTNTDANGEFQLLVDHGWKGKITPSKEGFTFTPDAKSFDTVMQNVPNASFIARVRMVRITDSIVFGDEPIQGVTITAEPGGATAVTDAKGKYSLEVPYNWTGDLFPTKEGFEFNPPSIPYSNVTEDIDNTAPAQPAYTPPVERTPPPARTTQPPARTTQPPVTQGLDEPPMELPQTADPERQALLDRIARYEEMLRAGGQGTTAGDLTTLRPDQTLTTAPPIEGAMPSRNRFSVNLLDILMQISEKTGVKIGVDATVKSVPVAVDFDWTTMPVPLALQRILEPTGYTFRAVEDAYLVYHPITNTFMGDDLRQALQDIALAAGVTIVTDPNVAGEVYAELNNVPLETALRTILAGSPFVVKVTPDYYLVADRGVEGDAFLDISETRAMRLNYSAARDIMPHISPAFQPYVRANTDPNSHVISITAAPNMIDRIMADINSLDVRPRQVLLDARIVVMERTDLLDLGVEWGFPQISAGLFGTSYDTGTGGSWPWGVQIGYTPDQTFTNSLLMALNLLEENSQAEIVSNPQVLAQDGKASEIRVMREEYYMLQPQVLNTAQFFSTTEMVTITSGTMLNITPRIGDNNDITLELAAEVSNSIPAAAETSLPVVTRRTARNVVTVQDGGTVALAGLTENRSKKTETEVPGLGKIPLIGNLFKNHDNQGITREVAVFVTAHLVPEAGQVTYEPTLQPMMAQSSYNTRPQPQLEPQFPSQPQAAPTGDNYQEQLRQSLMNQPR